MSNEYQPGKEISFKKRYEELKNRLRKLFGKEELFEMENTIKEILHILRDSMEQGSNEFHTDEGIPITFRVGERTRDGEAAPLMVISRTATDNSTLYFRTDYFVYHSSIRAHYATYQRNKKGEYTLHSQTSGPLNIHEAKFLRTMLDEAYN